MRRYTIERPHAHCRIVNNICSMACADPTATPSASQPDPPLDAEEAEEAAPRQESEAAAPANPAAEAAAIARMVGLGTCVARFAWCRCLEPGYAGLRWGLWLGRCACTVEQQQARQLSHLLRTAGCGSGPARHCAAVWRQDAGGGAACLGAGLSGAAAAAAGGASGLAADRRSPGPFEVDLDCRFTLVFSLR